EGNTLLSGAQQTSGSQQINTVNVTENCAGDLAGTTSPANRVAAQLQTAWVTLGKQTLSTSRKRRRGRLPIGRRLTICPTFAAKGLPGNMCARLDGWGG